MATALPRSFQDVLLPLLPYVDTTELDPDADLIALGLDSMGVMQVLAALEDTFGIELADELLTEETFATAGTLWAAMEPLLTTAPETEDSSA